MRPGKIREVDDAIYFKPKNEGVYIFFTFSIAPEIEVKGEEESSSFEKIHDKEKCKVVSERMACEDRQAALPC